MSDIANESVDVIFSSNFFEHLETKHEMTLVV
jgi:hypothetical protein